MLSLLLGIIYLSFISLGLPDSLLGAAWPVIHTEIGAPLSASGFVFMIIAVGTIVSSLLSDRLTRRLGAGRVTAISVAMTCAALFGFSFSRSYAMLCLWAIPYGLGAGGVDAALNNYVALHYASRHMSWLHCMWGVGASVGPYVMSGALTATGLWQDGYRIIGLVQVGITLLLFLSLPLWNRADGVAQAEDEAEKKPIPLREVLRLAGAKEIMLAFFCYCAIEQTTALWASSYLVGNRGMAETAAAGFAALFYLGITAGRAVNGFLTFRLSDTQLIRMGQGIIALGIVLLFLPLPETATLVGFAAIGLGCAPIYPCIIHSTPEHFGRGNSQAVIGVQMACAYIGTSLMPPLFGFLAGHSSIALLPLYIVMLLTVQVIAYQRVEHQTGNHSAR